MFRVVGKDGDEIGSFSGVTILDTRGKVLYRVLDGEIYAPVEYVDHNLQRSIGRMLGLVGNLDGDVGLSLYGEIIFRIER